MHRGILVQVLLFAFQGAALAANGPDGVEQLHPTIAGGRQWYAKWDGGREVRPHSNDPLDPVCRNAANVPLRIAGGVASWQAGTTRLYITTPTANLKPWRNVEMTIYARRGEIGQRRSYQSFDLAARSGTRHSDEAPCEGTSYHATARFDGQCGFKKEIWHTGGYTKLAPIPTPRPWPAVPKGKWVGVKFVCRNFDNDSKVRLQLYLDTEEQNRWILESSFDDAGGWKGERAGCDRPQDYIINEARPVVYFRTDDVDIEMRKFSVREIAPMP